MYFLLPDVGMDVLNLISLVHCILLPKVPPCSGVFSNGLLS